MSPLEYLFSPTTSLDAIDLKESNILEIAASMKTALLSASVTQSIAFEGPSDLSRWAFYRSVGGHLEIVSPFGGCRLPWAGLNLDRPVGLVNMRAVDDVSAWDVMFTDQWRSLRGEIASAEALKAKLLSDGTFEPLHTSMSFRGLGSRPDFWSIVALPSPPERIYVKDGAARLEAGGRVFSLPFGKVSEHVLAGRVQWAFPNETGFFVMQKR